MAAKNTITDITVNLTVPIPQQAFAFFEEAAQKKGKPVDQMLASAMQYWCDHQARGGIFLEAEDAQYLARINNGPFPSGKAIVRTIESALGREDGQNTYKWQIDPSLAQPLEDQAKAMGWTVEEIVNDVMNQAFVNGWAYALDPDQTMRLTQDDYDAIGKVLGKKQFFGADVAEYFRKIAEKGKAA